MKQGSFFLSKKHKEFLLNTLTSLSSTVVSIFLIATLIALTLFMISKVADLYSSIFAHELIDIAHDIAYILVLIKAFRVLLFYLQTEHVSIKYIVEISIIAPAIEIIFSAQSQPIWLSILFAFYGIANLVIYIHFHDKLTKVDQSRYNSENIDFQS